MVIFLGLLLCAAPAAAVGNQHARATDSVPLDRVEVAPRRLSGYVMDDTTIRTAVSAWLADATAAEATYGHISTWETGGVTDMSHLFCGTWWSECNSAAKAFNEDISA